VCCAVLGAADASQDVQRSSKQALFQAMLDVPWVMGEGVPADVEDGGEYARMLEAAEEAVAACRWVGGGRVCVGGGVRACWRRPGGGGGGLQGWVEGVCC